jgi:hypothetical protein
MKGNNPAAWEKFLSVLDDKMQFNLLDRVRKVSGYHFESDTLYIEASTPSEAEFLNKSLQTLTLFAIDACKVKEVKIKSS